MSDALSPVWAQLVSRVRLGIETFDALGRHGPMGGIGVHVENVQTPWPVQPGDGSPTPFGDQTDGAGLPALRRSWSGRFAVVFDRPPVGGDDHVAVRLVSAGRRYVPRRLAIPAPTIAAVTAAEAAHDLDPAQPLVPRGCRPLLYPGAAYGAAAGATVIRGRVVWEGTSRPVRWTRVTARPAQPIDVLDENGEVVDSIQPGLGLAHGDDRGEFVLVLGVLPSELYVLPELDLDVELLVEAAAEPASDDPVDSPTGSRTDPLWDLPLETVGSLDPADGVTLGVTTPAGFTSADTSALTVRRGVATRPAISISLQP
jgi:hypothetical protein